MGEVAPILGENLFIWQGSPLLAVTQCCPLRARHLVTVEDEYHLLWVPVRPLVPSNHPLHTTPSPPHPPPPKKKYNVSKVPFYCIAILFSPYLPYITQDPRNILTQTPADTRNVVPLSLPLIFPLIKLLWKNLQKKTPIVMVYSLENYFDQQFINKTFIICLLLFPVYTKRNYRATRSRYLILSFHPRKCCRDKHCFYQPQSYQYFNTILIFALYKFTVLCTLQPECSRIVLQ